MLPLRIRTEAYLDEMVKLSGAQRLLRIVKSGLRKGAVDVPHSKMTKPPGQAGLTAAANRAYYKVSRRYAKDPELAQLLRDRVGPRPSEVDIFRASAKAGLRKEASAAEILHWLHANPGAVAGLAVAKAHLASAYGHKIPGVRRVLEVTGRGAAHAGLEHGLRGEKPLHGLTRAAMAVVDPNLKVAYETGLEGGKSARQAFPRMPTPEILKRMHSLGEEAGKESPRGAFLAKLGPQVGKVADESLTGNRVARAMTTHVHPGEALMRGMKRFARDE